MASLSHAAEINASTSASDAPVAPRSTSVICAGQGRWLLIEFEAGEGRLILLELIDFDEGQPVTIEHEPDVYEEKAGVRASEQKFFLQQFTQAAPVGNRVQARTIGVQGYSILARS